MRISDWSSDVCSSDLVQRFVAAAEELAPLAIAVHNAGSNRPAPFLEQAGDEFEVHWREHALGGFNLARAALPALLARQDTNQSFSHGAGLFFTGASGSLRGKAGFAAFSAAKIGRASGRERGGKSVWVAGVAGAI